MWVNNSINLDFRRYAILVIVIIYCAVMLLCMLPYRVVIICLMYLASISGSSRSSSSSSSSNSSSRAVSNNNLVIYAISILWDQIWIMPVWDVFPFTNISLPYILGVISVETKQPKWTLYIVVGLQMLCLLLAPLW